MDVSDLACGHWIPLEILVDFDVVVVVRLCLCGSSLDPRLLRLGGGHAPGLSLVVWLSWQHTLLLGMDFCVWWTWTFSLILMIVALSDSFFQCCRRRLGSI